MTSTVVALDPIDADISDFSWVFGKSIDRLVSVEMRPTGMPFGKIDRLLDAALAESGHPSQTMMAAEVLRQALRPGDTVFVLTGAGFPPYLPAGENDGPIGAATLARTLLLGLGAVPVYIAEPHQIPPIAAASEAAGVPIRPSNVPVEHARGAFIEPSPTDNNPTVAWAETLYDRYRPAAVIFIERLGPNRKGISHGSTGRTAPEFQIDLTAILEVATSRGVPSIGIGDAGNEIGFGRIFDKVRDIQEYGAHCQCPCGDGMATSAATDILVVASVSNWGAYGIDACLSHLLRRPELVQGPVMSRRVIDACFRGGASEAIFCSQQDLVDGIAGETSVSLVQVMQEMVRISLLPTDSGPAH